MRAQVFSILMAFGFVGVAAPATTAPVTPGGTATQADTTAARVDTTAARVDTTATKPTAPAPAVQTPAPASTPTPAAAAPAVAAPAAAAAAPAPAKKAPNDRVYYGGTVTLSFGSPSRFGIYPMMGYKLTPKISGGAEVGYEYLSYSGQSTNNYGGSVFGRYRVGRNLYAHAEYQLTNYEIFTTLNSSSREWVPALLLGGGYSRAIGPRTSVYGEVLFDVLQDPNSPYSNWEPVVNFGVAAGF